MSHDFREGQGLEFSRAPSTKTTILVVDDNTQTLGLMAFVLKQAGYTVLCATDGSEALATIQSHSGQIDLLLGDVEMPGMSGISLAEQATVDRPGLRVLLVSGIPAHGGRTNFPFLEKPFSPERLRSAVAQVLEGPTSGMRHEGSLRAFRVPATTDRLGATRVIQGATGLHLRGGGLQIATDIHIDDDRLEQYASNLLSEMEEQKCDEHLLICEQCRAALEEVDAFRSAMRGAAREIKDKELKSLKRRALSLQRWFPMGMLAVAAMVSICLGIYQPKRMSARPAMVTLRAMRGMAETDTVQGGSPFLLKLDTSGLSTDQAYQVEIVDERGDVVRRMFGWQGSAVSVDTLSPGIYFVRIRSHQSEVLREFSLRAIGE